MNSALKLTPVALEVAYKGCVNCTEILQQLLDNLTLETDLEGNLLPHTITLARGAFKAVADSITEQEYSDPFRKVENFLKKYSVQSIEESMLKSLGIIGTEIPQYLERVNTEVLIKGHNLDLKVESMEKKAEDEWRYVITGKSWTGEDNKEELAIKYSEDMNSTGYYLLQESSYAAKPLRPDDLVFMTLIDPSAYKIAQKFGISLRAMQIPGVLDNSMVFGK